MEELDASGSRIFPGQLLWFNLEFYSCTEPSLVAMNELPLSKIICSLHHPFCRFFREAFFASAGDLPCFAASTDLNYGKNTERTVRS
jgi:hypothetical protein